MSNLSKKMAVLSQIKQTSAALSLPEISALIAHTVPERTLRRWLKLWLDMGILQRTGQKRGTRYRYLSDKVFVEKYTTDSANSEYIFLQSVAKHKRAAVLEQFRDLWTYNSTALEGNTLTLGDTHAVLGLGLTVSGKPLKEHQEVLGHAKAIDILYQRLHQPLSKKLIYALHTAVQTEIALDIYKPIGAWKLEINGTYALSSQEKQVFIEYAHPVHVDALMNEVIETINTVDIARVTLDNAAYYYAKIHMAIVHIHPFWDGNGRIARLVANIILLKAGLPPLVVEAALRREYIECLADYQTYIGQLTNMTGVWPNEELLKPFTIFCQQSYAATKSIIADA